MFASAPWSSRYRTYLVPGPTAAVLGRVVTGTGNGDGFEGVVNGHVLGTYMHGPLLPKNADTFGYA